MRLIHFICSCWDDFALMVLELRICFQILSARSAAIFGKLNYNFRKPYSCFVRGEIFSPVYVIAIVHDWNTLTDTLDFQDHLYVDL